ncbi:DUF3592 domain-containing protein [Chitinophaga horti]|uniref:DUF3592 domain-containing protein n=1 Tax=Chitinophaga horti TaxID=2920382 RepID=A0ABY6J8A5_9BACT|nr:DUF3592 domain-containing protein [Chitinophaga horti]UYQ94807.1 DUF3592 domain-containing protein [Chitinophaga horti]
MKVFDRLFSLADWANSLNWTAVLIMLMGGLAFLTALIRLRKQRRLKRNCVETTGMVVRFSSRLINGRFSMHPVITFKDHQNKEFTLVSEISTGASRLKRGESVVVVYDRSDPKVFVLKEDTLLDWVPVVIIIISFAIMLFGGLWLRLG